MSRIGRAWDLAEVEQAVTLHRAGATYADIAASLDRSKTGVAKVLSVNGFRKPVGRPATTHYYDGPAIAKCRSFERMKEDAIVGSQRLRRAIELAGVRP